MRRPYPEVLPSGAGSGDFAALACLQQHRAKLTAMCRQSCRITASDRAISASARRRGTKLGIVGSLSAATFPRIIWISCMRRPSVIHDRSPF